MRTLRLLLLAALLGTAHVAAATDVVKAANGREYHTGLLKLPPTYQGLGGTFVDLDDCENLPAEFDLRDLGVVPSVKDQGNCGSCWSFAKTGSLESAYAANSGSMLDLSEQELVSCDRNNYGCNGGLLNSNEYQVRIGQAVEKDFAYTARDTQCKTGLQPAVKGTDWVRIRTVNDKQVQCALYKSHTIPWVTVAAGGSRWSNPPTGDNGTWPSCGSRGTNHAVGIVGWKTINGVVHYKMKNSWGKNWGSTAGKPGAEKGYALMKLGCDMLGDEVAYIMTNAMPCKPPVVKLPIEITANAGDEFPIGTKAQQAVTYTWLKGSATIGTGSTYMVTVGPVEAEYKVVGENSCGRAESTVRVKPLAAATFAP